MGRSVLPLIDTTVAFPLQRLVHTSRFFCYSDKLVHILTAFLDRLNVLKYGLGIYNEQSRGLQHTIKDYSIMHETHRTRICIGRGRGALEKT